VCQVDPQRQCLGIGGDGAFECGFGLRVITLAQSLHSGAIGLRGLLQIALVFRHAGALPRFDGIGNIAGMLGGCPIGGKSLGMCRWNCLRQSR
jgi:hypothetical protein